MGRLWAFGAALLALGAGLSGPAVAAQAGPALDQPIDECLRAAQVERSGAVVSVSYLAVSMTRPLYVIEIRDQDGVEWHMRCGLEKTQILTIDKEVKSMDAPAFQGATIDTAKAVQIAKRTINAPTEANAEVEAQAVEYLLREDGTPVIVVHLVDPGGTETKVVIDASTGGLLENSVMYWDIGVEPAERFGTDA